MNVIVLLLVLAAVAGTAAAVIAAIRIGRQAQTPADRPSRPGLDRLTASVRAGSEQVLIALARDLQLPHGPDGAGYGDLYLNLPNDETLQIRSHSMIGRGLLATIALQRTPGRTRVTYSISQLPADETLHARVLDFELRLISALRHIDPKAAITATDIAMRDLNSTRSRQTPSTPPLTQ